MVLLVVKLELFLSPLEGFRVLMSQFEILLSEAEFICIILRPKVRIERKITALSGSDCGFITTLHH